ncbi:MAG: hypothetical protein HN797_03740 [Tateyamaria sp.]|nr:hypothetical protein [Tateyamaria sp.]
MKFNDTEGHCKLPMVGFKLNVFNLESWVSRKRQTRDSMPPVGSRN